MVRLLVAALVSMLCLSPAFAGYWKYGRPGGAWSPVTDFDKYGIPALESEWQYECSKATTRDQADNGQRYLAVYIFSVVAEHAQCFYERDPERTVVIHKGEVLDPNVPVNRFTPSYGPPKLAVAKPYVERAGVALGNFSFRGTPGLCLNVPGGTMNDGVPVLLLQCQKAGSERFLVSTGQRGQFVAMPGIKGSGGADMCLDYAPGRGVDGDIVHLAPCHQLYTSVSDTQVWWPTGQQIRSSVNGRCIAPATNAANSYLVLKTCQPGGSANTPFDFVVTPY